MRMVMLGLLAASLFTAPSSGTSVRCGEPNKIVNHSFKVAIVIQLDITAGEEKSNLDGDMEYRYTWQRNGQERTLNLNYMQLKLHNKGISLMDVSMSREKLSKTENGKKEDFTLENMPVPMKQNLRELFDTPLCQLQVDEHGKEVKRKLLVDAKHQKNVSGMIANSLICHPPYYLNRDEWIADIEVQSGNGPVIRGKATYKKVASAKGKHVFKMSGTFTEPGKNADTVKELHMVLNGEQTYDPVQQEWISGNMRITLSMSMDDGKAPMKMKGTMDLKFEKLAVK